MKFHEVLDKIMTERKISTYRIREDTGIADSLIGYWRKGEKKPTLDKLIILANYLDVTLDYLAKGEDNSTILSDTEQLDKLSESENELVNCYRQLDNRGKSKVTTTAFEELERIEAKNRKAESISYEADAV